MPQMTIYLGVDTIGEIDKRAEPGDKRGTRSPVLRESLDRYFTLLERGRRSLRSTLTEAEVSLITDVLNSTLLEAHTVPLLAHEIEDALEDGSAQKWDVDGPALVAKLIALGIGETYALADAVERFWRATAKGENPELAGILA